ncbi:MAG: hypothetical protein IKZ59_06600 [Clostridia bacterium]|nr:hypothetical protein [Clostridia bacterium]
MLDIHSHILPAVDDGARNAEETARLLSQMKNQGVTAVVATPHFYPLGSVLDDFLELRATAAKEIAELCRESGITLFLGAEVLYYGGIGNSEDVKRLAFGGKYMLLELLGLKKIDDKVTRDISALKYDLGITPIIAHVERYARYSGYKKLLPLFENGDALCQINASFFTSKHETRAVKKLVSRELVSFIGSDCHSSVNRPVTLDKGISALRAISARQTRIIIQNGENLKEELMSFEK